MYIEFEQYKNKKKKPNHHSSNLFTNVTRFRHIRWLLEFKRFGNGALWYHTLAGHVA